VIFTIPSAIPFTAPVAAFTELIALLLLLHIPPVVAFVKTEEEPSHIDAAPDMAAGCVFTVIILATALPQPVLYDMVVVPEFNP
jgi:hypothetical protein